MPIIVDLSITLDGIEGLRLYDTFNCAGIPLKYYDRGIFGICGIKHSIGNGDWFHYTRSKILSQVKNESEDEKCLYEWYLRNAIRQTG